MPYQNVPSYGKRIRPQPLTVVYPKAESVRSSRRAPLQRSTSVYTPRPTALASGRQTRQAMFARNAVQPVQPKTRWFFKRRLVAAVAVAVVGFTIFHGFSGDHNVAQAIVSASPIEDVKKIIDPKTVADAAAATAQEARMRTYQQTVNSIIAAHAGETIAVSTADVSSDAAATSLTLGDQGTFTAASTAKLITALTLLHQVDQGKLTLQTQIQGQQAGALLQNMVINSDNTSWETLNNYLTHPLLRSYMSQLGFVEYDPDVNTFLPSDMTLLMKKFYTGQVISKTNTNLLLSYMQQANKQEYIVASVPTGYTVYHKAGWLDGLMHDVAIISNGQKTIVLAIYTYSGTTPGDNPDNQQLFKQITAAAVQAYYGQ